MASSSHPLADFAAANPHSFPPPVVSGAAKNLFSASLRARQATRVVFCEAFLL